MMNNFHLNWDTQARKSFESALQGKSSFVIFFCNSSSRKILLSFLVKRASFLCDAKLKRSSERNHKYFLCVCMHVGVIFIKALSCLKSSRAKFMIFSQSETFNLTFRFKKLFSCLRIVNACSCVYHILYERAFY